MDIDENNKSGIVYYPDLIILGDKEIKRNRTECVLFLITNIRKKHEGIWYVLRYLDKHIFYDDYDKVKHEAIEMFIRDTYKIIIFEKVDLDIKDESGYQIWQVDKCQLDEEERLK